MRKLFLLALMAAAFSGNTEAQAESKHVLNYQGTIKITNGSELKNQVTMNFKIYDAPVGGKLLWQEDQRTVNIKDGFFNVYIGEMQSDLAERVDFSKPVYLEITVDNEVLPRTLISASPYSFNAGIAEVAGSVADGSIKWSSFEEDELKAGGVLEGKFPNPTLNADKIKDNSIDGNKIKAGDYPHIKATPTGLAKGDLRGNYPEVYVKNGAIDTKHLKNNAVIADVIAKNAVISDKIEDGAVIAGKLGDKAVLTKNIEDKNVTAEKIADGAVIAGKLGEASVGSTNIADGAVIAGKLGEASVGSTNIADGAVVAGKLGDDAVVTKNIKNDAVTAEKIADGAVVEGKLGDDAVDSTNIKNGAVIAGKLGDDAVVTKNIKNEAVTAEKIADGAVISGKLGNDAVEATNIKDGAVVAGKLGDDAVVTKNIKNEAVTAEKIADGAVIAGKLGDKAVLTKNIEDKAVTAEKIAEGAITLDKIKGAPADKDKVLQLDKDGKAVWSDIAGGLNKLKDTPTKEGQMFVYQKGEWKLTEGNAPADGSVLKYSGNKYTWGEDSGFNLPYINDKATDGLIKAENEDLFRITRTDGKLGNVMELANTDAKGEEVLKVTGRGNHNGFTNGAMNVTATSNSSYDTNVNKGAVVKGIASKGTNIGLDASAEGGKTAVGVFAHDKNAKAPKEGVSASLYAASSKGNAIYAEGTPEMAKDNYVAQVKANNAGRAMLIEGGDWNRNLLAKDDDDRDLDNAALVVVAKPKDARPQVITDAIFDPLHPFFGAEGRTAIKTYGDIWANSAIGGTTIVGRERIIVGIKEGLMTTITPPATADAPVNFDRVIEAPGAVFNGTDEAKGGIKVVKGATENFKVTPEGDVTAHDATINGTLDVNGTTAFTGKINAKGGIEVKPGTTAVFDVTTTGNVTANDLTVNAVTASGEVQANGGLKVDDKFTVADGSGNIATKGTLQVDGNSTLGSSNAVTNAIRGTVNVSDEGKATTVKGTLQVDQAAAFKNNVTIGATGAGADLLVKDGNIKVTKGTAETFKVTPEGDVTARKVTASGEVQANGGLKVVNGTEDKFTVTTAGDVTANKLTANGDATFNAKVTLGAEANGKGGNLTINDHKGATGTHAITSINSREINLGDEATLDKVTVNATMEAGTGGKIKATSATDLVGGNKGTLVYQTNTDDTDFITAPTATNQVLVPTVAASGVTYAWSDNMTLPGTLGVKGATISQVNAGATFVQQDLDATNNPVTKVQIGIDNSTGGTKNGYINLYANEKDNTKANFALFEADATGAKITNRISPTLAHQTGIGLLKTGPLAGSSVVGTGNTDGADGVMLAYKGNNANEARILVNKEGKTVFSVDREGDVTAYDFGNIDYNGIPANNKDSKTTLNATKVEVYSQSGAAPEYSDNVGMVVKSVNGTKHDRIYVNKVGNRVFTVNREGDVTANNINAKGGIEVKPGTTAVFGVNTDGDVTARKVTASGEVQANGGLKVVNGTEDKFTVTTAGAVTASGEVQANGGLKVINGTEDKFTVTTAGAVTASGEVQAKGGIKVVNGTEDKFTVTTAGAVTANSVSATAVKGVPVDTDPTNNKDVTGSLGAKVIELKSQTGATPTDVDAVSLLLEDAKADNLPRIRVMKEGAQVFKVDRAGNVTAKDITFNGTLKVGTPNAANNGKVLAQKADGTLEFVTPGAATITRKDIVDKINTTGTETIKVANLTKGTANQILVSTGSATAWSSDLTVPGTTDLKGNVTLGTGSSNTVNVKGSAKFTAISRHTASIYNIDEHAIIRGYKDTEDAANQRYQMSIVNDGGYIKLENGAEKDVVYINPNGIGIHDNKEAADFNNKMAFVGRNAAFGADTYTAFVGEKTATHQYGVGLMYKAATSSSPQADKVRIAVVNGDKANPTFAVDNEGNVAAKSVTAGAISPANLVISKDDAVKNGDTPSDTQKGIMKATAKEVSLTTMTGTDVATTQSVRLVLNDNRADKTRIEVKKANASVFKVDTEGDVTAHDITSKGSLKLQDGAKNLLKAGITTNADSKKNGYIELIDQDAAGKRVKLDSRGLHIGQNVANPVQNKSINLGGDSRVDAALGTTGAMIMGIGEMAKSEPSLADPDLEYGVAMIYASKDTPKEPRLAVINGDVSKPAFAVDLEGNMAVMQQEAVLKSTGPDVKQAGTFGATGNKAGLTTEGSAATKKHSVGFVLDNIEGENNPRIGVMNDGTPVFGVDSEGDVAAKSVTAGAVNTLALGILKENGVTNGGTHQNGTFGATGVKAGLTTGSAATTHSVGFALDNVAENSARIAVVKNNVPVFGVDSEGDVAANDVTVMGKFRLGTPSSTNTNKILAQVDNDGTIGFIDPPSGGGTMTGTQIVTAINGGTDKIGVAKLADGEANQILVTSADGNSTQWSSDLTVPGNLTVNGAIKYSVSSEITDVANLKVDNASITPTVVQLGAGITGTVTSVQLGNPATGVGTIKYIINNSGATLTIAGATVANGKTATVICTTADDTNPVWTVIALTP